VSARAWAYVHPCVGGAVVLLLVYTASLGLRARNERRLRTRLLAQHARLGPLVLALVLATWLSGLLSTWLARPDLELGASTHTRTGVALLAALCGSAVTARWLHRPLVRSVHPWWGGVAVLLAAAQVFFGLQITP
jgi:hypothetical protein